MWRVQHAEDGATIVLRESEHGTLPRFEGRPIRHRWPRVSGGLEGVAGNFVYLTSGVLVCDDRAMGVLGLPLADEVERLPIRINGVEFHVLNVVNVIDCLDRERSAIKYFSTGRVMKVERYVFHEGRMEGSALFKIPELDTTTFATDIFRTVVLDHGLTGLRFESVGSAGPERSSTVPRRP